MAGWFGFRIRCIVLWLLWLCILLIVFTSRLNYCPTLDPPTRTTYFPLSMTSTTSARLFLIVPFTVAAADAIVRPIDRAMHIVGVNERVVVCAITCVADQHNAYTSNSETDDEPIVVMFPTCTVRTMIQSLYTHTCQLLCSVPQGHAPQHPAAHLTVSRASLLPNPSLSETVPLSNLS